MCCRWHATGSGGSFSSTDPSWKDRQIKALFTSTASGRIAEDIRTYETMGVDEVVFDFRSPPASKTIENMDHFMKEVAPLVD